MKRNLPAGHNVIMMQGAPCKLINEGMTCAALNDKWQMKKDNLKVKSVHESMKNGYAMSKKQASHLKKCPCEVKKWGGMRCAGMKKWKNEGMKCAALEWKNEKMKEWKWQPL